MTRTVQFASLLCLIISGINLVACGQPAPEADPLSPVHPTRTAEAAAVETIEAALAAEEATPKPPPSIIIVVTATSTPTPVPLHPEPTSTHPPIETPTPLPCSLAADRQLSGAWDRTRLGCPATQANIIWAAWQPFEGGYMLWRSDTGKIVVLYHDGTWTDFPDQWAEGAFIPSRGSPPAGRLAPVRGFGYIWGHHDEVADRLGWALEDEKGFCANVQAFEQGFIFHSSTILHCQGELYNWATHPNFAPLFFSVHGDGHWQRHQ